MADTSYGQVRVCGAFLFYTHGLVPRGLMPRVFFAFAHTCAI